MNFNKNVNSAVFEFTILLFPTGGERAEGLLNSTEGVGSTSNPDQSQSSSPRLSRKSTFPTTIRDSTRSRPLVYRPTKANFI